MRLEPLFEGTLRYEGDAVWIYPYGGAEGVHGQFVVPGGGHLKVPTPRGCSGWFGAASCSVAGFAHAVALAVGDDDVAVVKQPVEHADRGGVLG